MTIFKSKSITPGNTDTPIKFDKNFKCKVIGDSDLVASNIKLDEEIFGVTGTFTPEISGAVETEVIYKETIAVGDPLYLVNGEPVLVENAIAEADMLPGMPYFISITDDDVYIAIAHNTLPYLTVYKRTGDTFTKLPTLSDIPGALKFCAFSHDGTYLAITSSVTPYIQVYKRSGDTFTKLASPTALADTCYGVDFSSDGTYMAVGYETSPYLVIYKRSGDTFTKLADPADIPESYVVQVKFSADDTYLIFIQHDGAYSFHGSYKRSGDTFTRLATPSDINDTSAVGLYGIDITSDGVYLVMTLHLDTSPVKKAIKFYKRTGDTFNALSNPATLPTDDAHGIAFNKFDNILYVADSDGYLFEYSRSGDTFTYVDKWNGTETTLRAIAISKDDKYLFTEGLTDGVNLEVYRFQTLAYKSANALSALTNKLGAGIAIESGVADDVKTVIQLLGY